MCRHLSVSDVCDDGSHMFMCGIKYFQCSYSLVTHHPEAIHKIYISSSVLLELIAIISVCSRHPWKTEKPQLTLLFPDPSLVAAGWAILIASSAGYSISSMNIFTVSICTVAVYYTLKYCMHGSLFFFKKTTVHNVLECYMHKSPLFSKNNAVCYILECYMHGSSIQFVVFKPLSYCFEEQ